VNTHILNGKQSVLPPEGKEIMQTFYKPGEDFPDAADLASILIIIKAIEEKPDGMV
jgi:hypothetical protein